MAQSAGLLEARLPDVAEAAELIETHASDEFVCAQLLQLAGLLDYSDEAGRRTLVSLLKEMLCSLGTSDVLVGPATEDERDAALKQRQDVEQAIEERRPRLEQALLDEADAATRED